MKSDDLVEATLRYLRPLISGERMSTVQANLGMIVDAVREECALTADALGAPGVAHAVRFGTIVSSGPDESPVPHRQTVFVHRGKVYRGREPGVWFDGAEPDITIDDK